MSFKPPYCPNPNCKWHTQPHEAKFHSYGWRKILRYPFVSRRFKCLNCDRVFTSSFFSLCYRDRKEDTYAAIYQARKGTTSKQQIARNLGLSLDTVLRRLSKMCRQQLLRQAKDLYLHEIQESVAYDGIENFSFSQFDPNNVNHAVGRESFFVYDFNLSPINRKGRMSIRQQARKKWLEDKHGKYPARRIEADSKRIFQRLADRAKPGLILHTDNHFLYRRAISNIKSHQITHLITPAKLARNYRNRLFAINHCDMLTRHRLADFKRETIAFAKTSQAMMESFIFFAVDKNYCSPKFSKAQKVDPNANTESPAMRLGIAKRILTFREFFKVRITKMQVLLNKDWLNFFERRDLFSRRPIRSYCGI